MYNVENIMLSQSKREWIEESKIIAERMEEWKKRCKGMRQLKSVKNIILERNSNNLSPGIMVETPYFYKENGEGQEFLRHEIWKHSQYENMDYRRLEKTHPLSHYSNLRKTLEEVVRLTMNNHMTHEGRETSVKQEEEDEEEAQDLSMRAKDVAVQTEVSNDMFSSEQIRNILSDILNPTMMSKMFSNKNGIKNLFMDEILKTNLELGRNCKDENKYQVPNNMEITEASEPNLQTKYDLSPGPPGPGWIPLEPTPCPSISHSKVFHVPQHQTTSDIHNRWQNTTHLTGLQHCEKGGPWESLLSESEMAVAVKSAANHVPQWVPLLEPNPDPRTCVGDLELQAPNHQGWSKHVTSQMETCGSVTHRPPQSSDVRQGEGMRSDICERPGSSDSARGRPGRLSKDEKVAAEAGIPFSAMEMVNTSMDEFNELLSSNNLTGEQVDICRDIRRRGKNKIAAQNCRKRKIDLISVLESDVQTARTKKEHLLRDRADLVREEELWRGRLRQLEDFILASLGKEGGRWKIEVNNDNQVILTHLEIQ